MIADLTFFRKVEVAADDRTLAWIITTASLVIMNFNRAEFDRYHFDSCDAALSCRVRASVDNAAEKNLVKIAKARIFCKYERCALHVLALD